MNQTPQRHALLQAHLPLLAEALRGIEKEGLRVDQTGRLATTPHPAALGSALTNPKITTDYSEALLELITGTQRSVSGVLDELEEVHRFVTARIGDELIWSQSMPALLPESEADIPIGWYGSSNSGMLKHVYRRGLAERYGKPMQCIAGLHYNYSLPDEIWPILDNTSTTLTDQRSKGYLALIRNFTRYSWLLMYLFGASPAVSTNFLGGVQHDLIELDADTLYRPYATSLRMSGLGYNNKDNAQSELQLCYNDIETFIHRIYDAVTTPWPAYEEIGTHRDGEWIQLSPNMLQIENEYYSSIRPKRTGERGERPSTALARRGVQYIEVRCLDLDPYSPVGISAQTCHFLDTFLLFCAVEPSAYFPNNGFCRDSHENFSLVAEQGRKPQLELIKQNKPIGLRAWGREIIDAMQPYAELLDQAHGGHAHTSALEAQANKIDDDNLTPSGTLLRQLRNEKISLHEFTLKQSAEHQRALLSATPVNTLAEQTLTDIAAQSVKDQAVLEQSSSESFDDYVARYHASLHKPASVV